MCLEDQCEKIFRVTSLYKIFKENLYIYIYFFFFFFTARLGLGLHTLFVQYYSVICCPSDRTVGRPRAEFRTRDGRSRGKDSNH